MAASNRCGENLTTDIHNKFTQSRNNCELEGIGTATTDTWHVVADGLNLRSADDSEFEVWRTDGISLGTGVSFTLPARGLYIVRHGNTVMKVSI